VALAEAGGDDEIGADAFFRVGRLLGQDGVEFLFRHAVAAHL